MPESDKELSGKDLDAAVAERVMGWIWLSRAGQGSAWLFPPDSKDVDTGEQGMFGEPIIERSYWPHFNGAIVGPFIEYDGKSQKNESYVPHYSESIEAAMQVVEKLRDKKNDRYCEMTNIDGPWEAMFWQGATPLGKRQSDSLPEAICRAALAAIGSKPD